jgi:hypothetical protein
MLMLALFTLCVSSAHAAYACFCYAYAYAQFVWTEHMNKLLIRVLNIRLKVRAYA